MDAAKRVCKIGAALLVDFVIAIVIVEVILRLIGYYTPSPYPHGPIAFLKGAQTVIESHGPAFTYVPHMHGRSEHVFASDTDFKVAFDYSFPTNNLGLVQDNDIFPGRKSVLVLGDSFAEGVGSPPWFTTLAATIDKSGYQPINGGLRGTGFYLWLQLAKYLESQGMQIEKLIIVFTSGDYDARPMSFPEGYLRCLSAPILENCDLTAYYFLPLPPRAQLPQWIDAVRQARFNPARMARSRLDFVRGKLERLLPATHQIYNFLKEKIRPPPPDAETVKLEAQSRDAIDALLARYGAKNIIFLHVPRKHELGAAPDGLRARQAIKAAGGELVDGFYACGLLASDYHDIDGHPNDAGYAKLSTCVTQAFRKIVAN